MGTKFSIKEFIKLENLIYSLMKVEWLLSFILIISFTDMYFSIIHNISFIEAIHRWKEYFVNPIDYIYMLIIFSIIYAVVFPALRMFYIHFLSHLLYKCHINVFSIHNIEKEHFRDFQTLFQLEIRAANDNNMALLEFCKKKRIEQRNIYFIYSALWGVVIFTVIQLITTNILPITLNLCQKFYFYMDNGTFISRFLLSVVMFTVFTPFIVFLFLSFRIESGNIFYPIEKKSDK